MTGRIVRVLAAVLLSLVIGAGFMNTASAQDFPTLISSAMSANELLVAQSLSATQATDLATAQARVSAAIQTGKAVEADLEAALAIAPDDAARSRVSAILTHIQAALENGEQALEATTLDVATSKAEAMRAEAAEALAEFPTSTVVAATTAPAVQLPVTGDPGPSLALLAMAIGMAAIVVGAAVARRSVP